MKAIFNDVVIAESEDTIYLEGNHFPAESVDERYLKPSAMKSVCFWKGLASYFTVEAGGESSRHAAWTYRHPPPWIRKIRDHVAFWGRVEVTP